MNNHNKYANVGPSSAGLVSNMNCHLEFNVTDIILEIGELPPEVASEQFKQLEANKDRLRLETATLEATEAVEVDAEEALAQIMAFLGNFRQILKEGSLDEQRLLIQCFVDRIEVDPDAPNVAIYMYKVPEFNLEELQEATY